MRPIRVLKRLAWPPEAQERFQVVRREMTFGERTYLITAAPAPPPPPVGVVGPITFSEEPVDLPPVAAYQL